MSQEMTRRQALLVLNSLPGIGPITLNRLLGGPGGDARLVLAAGGRLARSVEGVTAEAAAAIADWQNHFDLAREEERMAQGGIDAITGEDETYPAILREIHDPPIALYRKGAYGFEHPCVAIVGSRRPTQYGISVARGFASELANLGFCIVSGLARGIDTAAHEGALDAGGRTAAILGTGIDIVYPPENLELFRRIAANGALLSEFPLGRRATINSFAMRNRIVSGISVAVVVVESAVDGGAMITSRFAGEQGRPLFAVPGRIDQSTSGGCHQLIRDGATLVTCVDDILSELNYLGGLRPAPIPQKPGAASPMTGELTANERAVLASLADGAILACDGVAAGTGLGSAETSAALMMLELKKLVGKRVDGAYEALPVSRPQK
jgi:DNA processing protein